MKKLCPGALWLPLVAACAARAPLHHSELAGPPAVVATVAHVGTVERALPRDAAAGLGVGFGAEPADLAARPSAAPAPAAWAAPAPRAESEGPWRLQKELGLPEWLELGIDQRTRYEYLSEEFRANREGSSRLVALRTLIAATFRFDPVRVGIEIMDSRQYGAPDRAVLNTTIVDAVELLQGYLGFENRDVFGEGDKLDVLVGRHTMDVGSRRLVARNRFRNTINAFTGVNAVWQSAGGSQVRAFYVLPVRRLPTDQDSLLDNDIQFDEEEEETAFYGVHGSRPFGERTTGELYALMLDEDDDKDVATRNRELLTVGARLVQEPKSGRFHYEWESAFQTGNSRATTSAADTTDLDHEAQFHHLTVGYQFGGETRPRLEALFDLATGDDDPTDGDNNRFDTLYGARRWEFGPTGIFSAIARSNIVSPGLRFVMKPSEKTQFMLTHRLHWLESDRDAWTAAGLVDPTGSSGDMIGQLTEFRLRYDPYPKNFSFEVGAAYLDGGEFARDAPQALGPEDSLYLYAMTRFWF